MPCVFIKSVKIRGELKSKEPIMARNKSEFVSASGTVFEIVKALSDEINSLGGDDSHLRKIISDRKLRKELAKKLVGNTAINVYQINVSGKINDAVKVGNYDWSNNDVNDQHFQADQSHGVEITLRHFDKAMNTDAVLKALDAEGLRPATISELLALGIQFPELQRQFPIIALGSFWRDSFAYRHVGCLRSDGGERRLSLYWFSFDWNDCWRFAAVRK